MTALWIHEAADRFWADAGGEPTALPRDLDEPIVWALPIAVIPLPGLCVAAVDAWLAERRIETRIDVRDRALRACVLVHEGNGLLFVDAEDGEYERRFSLAHEVAHYLVDYAIPRERACRRLGAGVRPVLDGRRAPSTDERIGAILAGVRLDIHLHLMERTPDGHRLGEDVSAAEQRADDLALELLAPLVAVRARVAAGAQRPDVEAVLRGTFGLPAAPAAAYARQLAPEPAAGSLFRRLFSSP